MILALKLHIILKSIKDNIYRDFVNILSQK